MRLADAPLIDARPQDRWGVPHATWFTLMGLGGGIFLVSRLLGLEVALGLWLGLPLVDVVSYVVIAVGGLVLVADLGRPFRFARAVLRPLTSWISRGALADLVFLVAGGVLVLPGLRLGVRRPFERLPWDVSGGGPLGAVVEGIAVVAAAVVVAYAGLVLQDRTAIPYWRSWAIPAQFVLSSLATSVALVATLQVAAGLEVAAGECWLLAGLLAALLAVCVRHLRRGADAPGKRESVARLRRGGLRGAFLGGVLGLGTLVPMLLAVAGALWAPWRDTVAVAAVLGTLPAGFALRLLTLRAGVHAPVHALIRLPGRADAARGDS